MGACLSIPEDVKQARREAKEKAKQEKADAQARAQAQGQEQAQGQAQSGANSVSGEGVQGASGAEGAKAADGTPLGSVPNATVSLEIDHCVLIKVLLSNCSGEWLHCQTGPV